MTAMTTSGDGVRRHTQPDKQSIRGIDIGFDVRRHPVRVALPSTVTTVDYDGLDGRPRSVTGDHDDICRALRAAGYPNTIVWE